ncbi:MAG TPA: cytochrome c, class I, partial [Nitrospiria bacterium]|nr:cytochrome c, class I [Nitrospiria bacterium]
MVRHVLFAICSVAVLVLLGAFAYREETGEWRNYQRDYYQKLAKFTNDPTMANTPLRIKQIWSKELGHADRC